MSIFGGPSVTLAESPNPILGASWGADDQIIFGTQGGGLFRVSGGGGEPEILTTPEQGENHLWPFIIPGREAVVFVVSTVIPQTDGQLAVLDLVSREIKPLGLAGVSPHYVSTGHLVYAAEDGSVRGVPFHAASLEVTGNPVPLVESVMVKASGAAAFSISDNGRLVYLLGGGGAGAQRSLVWVDRQGREEPIAAPLRSYVYPRISPDGARVGRERHGQGERRGCPGSASLTTEAARVFAEAWVGAAQALSRSPEWSGWIARVGKSPLRPPCAATCIRVSDAGGLHGARVVLDIRDEENDLWVWDLAGETLTRLTVYAGVDQYGHWTPDGQRVIFRGLSGFPNAILGPFGVFRG